VNSRNALIVHAVRGPILLITVGVLFALHQEGIVGFSRTWPLLIIVVGLMKLIERTVVPRTFAAPPPFTPPYTPPYPGQYPPPPYSPPPPPPSGGPAR